MPTAKTYLSLLLAPAMLAGVACINGCATEPATPQERRSLNDDVHGTLHDLKNQDASLDNFLNGAYAYVVFPSIGKGGAGVAAAYGRGEVFVQGKFVGYADMSQGTLGVSLGGETYSEVIVFENDNALADFEANKLEFEAGASAVALKAGAAATAKYNDKGIAVFTMPTGGLMFDISIGGQQFTYEASNNPPATRPSNGM